MDPENRRISVIVLNRRAEAAMLRDDGASPATIDNGGGANSLSPNNPLAKPIASIAPVLGRTSVAQ